MIHLNKNFVISLAVLTVNLLCNISCSEEESQTLEHSWPSKHMINSYLIPEEITTNQNNTQDSIRILVAFDGEYVRSGEDTNPPEEPHPLYNTFVEMYHDTSWYGKSSYLESMLSYPVNSFSIVCNEDYDDLHPAGTNLSDIAKLYVCSWGDAVLNGYEIQWNKRSESYNYWKAVEKIFGQFTQNEKCLWFPSVWIHLPKPSLSDNLELKITFSFEHLGDLTVTERVMFK